jgi:protease I
MMTTACAVAEVFVHLDPIAPKKVLIPLPAYGFDPTESAVPWKKIASVGHRIVFATPDGKVARADWRMLTGDGLPVLFRKSLMATPDAVRLYGEMSASPEFLRPISYEQIRPQDYDALLLPGGHDKGMRVYLESTVLMETVAWFFEHDRPVGAICHGTLLAARSRSQSAGPERTGKSVLWGRQTTGLTRNQELTAYFLTRWTLGDYYRTYPVLMADELVSHLKSPADYLPGPGFPIPLRRDTDRSLDVGFTVRDGRYLSGRWPGDAHRFATEFVRMLAEKP